MTPKDDDIFTVREFGQFVEQGKVAYKQGRFGEAIRAWREAQGVDPARRGELEGYLAKASAKQAAVLMDAARKAEKAEDGPGALAKYREILSLGVKDAALVSLVRERIESLEEKAVTVSSSLLGAWMGGMSLVTAVALWYILFKLD